MDYVIIVVVLALIQYLVFGILVGRARGKYNVPAPAMSGDPVFERYMRVQQNTAEQLIMFLPAIFLASHLWNPLYAAGLGVVYLVGRLLYLRSYVSDPKSRGAGFALTFIPSVIMLIASLIAAIGNVIGG
ncbi:MAG: MAPEG family protein [Gammaproteobacteria bacterium]|nr:MAPEG family protein [Gammaproteobacteria bacterium]MDD9896813.1 MAPEG family protein [Gammaproteobacteria bacterium]MDD9959378.1 MAPEG family protein [Gammaproteobacteria bacterium]